MEERNPGNRFFRSVKAMPGFILEVIMETGANIQFNFLSSLNSVRFEALRDDALFQSAYTDGSFLIFDKKDQAQVKISAFEFVDLILIDKSRWDDT